MLFSSYHFSFILFLAKEDLFHQITYFIIFLLYPLVIYILIIYSFFVIYLFYFHVTFSFAHYNNTSFCTLRQAFSITLSSFYPNTISIFVITILLISQKPVLAHTYPGNTGHRYVRPAFIFIHGQLTSKPKGAAYFGSFPEKSTSKRNGGSETSYFKATVMLSHILNFSILFPSDFYLRPFPGFKPN